MKQREPEAYKEFKSVTLKYKKNQTKIEDKRQTAEIRTSDPFRRKKKRKARDED